MAKLLGTILVIEAANDKPRESEYGRGGKGNPGLEIVEIVGRRLVGRRRIYPPAPTKYQVGKVCLFSPFLVVTMSDHRMQLYKGSKSFPSFLRPLRNYLQARES